MEHGMNMNNWYYRHSSTNLQISLLQNREQVIGGSKGGDEGLASLSVQFLSFSCSFWQISCQVIDFRSKRNGWRPTLTSRKSSIRHTEWWFCPGIIPAFLDGEWLEWDNMSNYFLGTIWVFLCVLLPSRLLGGPVSREPSLFVLPGRLCCIRSLKNSPPHYDDVRATPSDDVIRCCVLLP